MDPFLHDLWQLVSQPGALRENLAQIVETLGAGLTYAMLGLVVFAETGLVVTPFLPGDSLLFATGAVCATVASVAQQSGTAPTVRIEIMAAVLFAAAVLGDGVNYHIGRAIGPVAFSGRLRWLRREHLERTHAFFEKHGGRAVVIARFVPIVRTFAPFVAGIGAMTYLKFLVYNVLGAALWVGVLLTAGYTLGGLEWVQRHFEKVIIGIVIASVLPIIWEWLKARNIRRATAAGR
ncbi:MAG: VTT domain-containing protein [Planctomycetota bacterium]